jgi:hypothetical protein
MVKIHHRFHSPAPLSPKFQTPNLHSRSENEKPRGTTHPQILEPQITYFSNRNPRYHGSGGYETSLSRKYLLGEGGNFYLRRDFAEL